MFINDLFKLSENSNEEYYAVYNQRGKPMIMLKPVGKTARAYAEEKNLTIKGGPFDSHQATESFWIRSVLPNKKTNEDAIDDRFAAQYNTPQAKTKSQAIDQAFASGKQSDFDRLGVMSPQQIEIDDRAMRAKEPEQDAAVMRNTALTPGARTQTFKTNPKGVPIREFDDKSPYDSYVQSRSTLVNRDGKEDFSHRVASLNTDKSGNQRVRALDTSREFGDELTINAAIPKGVTAKIVPQQGDANIDEDNEVKKDQKRPDLSPEQKSQLRKDIDSVDYNKQQQPPAAPSREQKPDIRKAVKDYNKEQEVKEQGVAEAIPYALSAANAAAEYRRQGQAGGGYRGRIDIPVQSREDYLAVGKALTKAARDAGQRIDFGLSDGVMSVFSDTMTADELDQFIDDVLDQGLAEGGFDIPEIPRAPQPRPEPKNKTVDEGSVQDKLHQRHQELRKKRGAPDPEYYQQLKKSYDIEDDQQRHSHQAELKKKYGVNEAKQSAPQVTSSWEVAFKDGKKTVTKATHPKGSGPSNNSILASATLNNPTKQVVAVKQLNTPNSKTTKKTSVDSTGRFRWSDRDDSGTVQISEINEDSERYIEELGRAGYEIVTESATLCPECGGVAYENQILAEKQDACYHKVKSRYKVWPSAYASGALVRCRKKGAANWGNKSKK